MTDEEAIQQVADITHKLVIRGLTDHAYKQTAWKALRYVSAFVGDIYKTPQQVHHEITSKTPEDMAKIWNNVK